MRKENVFLSRSANVLWNLSQSINTRIHQGDHSLMDETTNRLSWKTGIGSQVFSIILLLFFTVVLVNALDFELIQKNEQIFINRFGASSVFIYLFIIVILYSFAFPSTVLGATSGATLGILPGIVVYVSASFLSSVIVYAVSRTILRSSIHKLIKKNEFLSNLEKVIDKEGFRFLFLVRFVPVHATFISALYGIVDIKPSRFLISCLFLLPELFFHVYVGYVAATMLSLVQSQQWDIADIIRIVTLFIAIVTVVYLGWIARKAIQKSN